MAQVAMGEDARVCKRCDFRWFAKRVSKPSQLAVGSGWSVLGQPQMAASAATKHQTKMMAYQRWSTCPNCGSTKVKSVSARGFTPTGLITGQAQPSTTTTPPIDAAPPGWYPAGEGVLRWWDGIQWTDHVHRQEPT